MAFNIPYLIVDQQYQQNKPIPPTFLLSCDQTFTLINGNHQKDSAYQTKINLKNKFQATPLILIISKVFYPYNWLDFKPDQDQWTTVSLALYVLTNLT